MVAETTFFTPEKLRSAWRAAISGGPHLSEAFYFAMVDRRKVCTPVCRARYSVLQEIRATKKTSNQLFFEMRDYLALKSRIVCFRAFHCFRNRHVFRPKKREKLVQLFQVTLNFLCTPVCRARYSGLQSKIFTKNTSNQLFFM